MTYLYNATFIISDRERGWWMDWMRTVYVPGMKREVPGARHELLSIDGPSSAGPGSTSYTSQWRCGTLMELGKLRKAGLKFCAQMTETKGESCLAFSSMMKEVEL